jgi:hypothetical protein
MLGSCNFLKFELTENIIKYYEVIDKIVKEQAKALLDTLGRSNAACDAISQRGQDLVHWNFSRDLKYQRRCRPQKIIPDGDGTRRQGARLGRARVYRVQ